MQSHLRQGIENFGHEKVLWKDVIHGKLTRDLAGFGRDVDWIDLAQDRNRQTVLVKALINLRFSKIWWIFY
jgi:hypothetical protein